MASKQDVTTRRIDQIAALTAQIKSADHVGRHNRLFYRRVRLFEEIDADPDRDEALQALLDHPDTEVRLITAWHCGWRRVMVEAAERAVTALALRQDKIAHDAQNWLDSRARMAAGLAKTELPPETLTYPAKPAPRGREAAVDKIGKLFPEPRAAAIVPLLRRAVALWPQRAGADPLAPRRRSSRADQVVLAVPGTRAAVVSGADQLCRSVGRRGGEPAS